MTTVAARETKPNEPARATLGALVLQTLEDKQVASAQELARELAKELGVPVGVPAVERECERLVRRHELDVLRPDDLQIIHAIDARTRVMGDGEAAAATSELNRAVGGNGRRAYGRCKRMEETIGLLKSRTRPSDRLSFFFPVTGEILTQTSVPRIQVVIEDLKRIARDSGLTPGRQIPEPVKRNLITKYRQYFVRLSEGESDKVRAQVRSFEAELMRVLRGTTLSDVVGFLGVRSFHPPIREWQLNRDANPAGPLIDVIIDWILDNSDVHGGLPGSVYLLPHRPKRPPAAAWAGQSVKPPGGVAPKRTLQESAA
jgi:hypothetical protein